MIETIRTSNDSTDNQAKPSDLGRIAGSAALSLLKSEPCDTNEISFILSAVKAKAENGQVSSPILEFVKSFCGRLMNDPTIQAKLTSLIGVLNG